MTSRRRWRQCWARRERCAACQTCSTRMPRRTSSTIIDEAERLNRFIANLLDMTKLESGAVVPNAALHDLGEVVGSALERTSRILAQHRVEVDLAKDLPMVEIDPVLFEQVLFNVLDNAAKYAPPGTTVRIQSWRDGD